MNDLPPANDPRNTWKNQKRETPIMTVHEIHEKVEGLRSRTRRTMIFNLVTALVITSIFIRVFVLYVHGAYGRISWSLVLVGAFYMLGYIVYESLRALRTERVKTEPGVSNCLRYYRRTLEQKRHHTRHMMLVAVPLLAGGIMTFVPALAMSMRYPEGNALVRLLPFCLILSSWLVLAVIMQRRIRREFKREFDTIEALEKEYRD